MNNLSEAYRDCPLRLQHIIPIDFHTVDTLPESHEWYNSGGLEQAIDEVSIPVIDLTDPHAQKLIGHAAKNWGIFQVTKHGVPLSLLTEVECEARRLFLLPAEEKIKVLRSPVGATGYGTARISPFYSKFMWHEGFTIIGSSLDHAKQLWPHDYNGFCDVIDEYQKKMKALAHKLLLLILKSLDISEEQIAAWAASTHKSEGALQLNSYPCCPNPSRAIGLAPHTDSLLLTILNQTHGSSALQIFHDDIGWVEVAPIRDALVVNVGDLLHILSNGKFPSVFHRVMVSEKKHRISVAYFYGPAVDFEVAPLLSKFEVPIYRTLSVKEFISIKAKHLDKALSFIRI